ncbi:MAG: AAA family ATPase [Blastocatellia bacterium]|nr:AAA family ATPase [Blastocatellia bacterium]
MITAITLKNFKGIRERVRIELKPITLLFGANSAGKSTILQAIHYAREVLLYQNLDADQTIQGGDNIDLGGFRNLVSDRDLKKKIHLRFEMDLSREDLPLYHSLSKWDFDISPKVKSAWVEIVIGWDEVRKYPYITNYLVGMNNDEEIAGIYSEGLGNIIKVNVSHPIFYDDPKIGQPVGSEKK